MNGIATPLSRDILVGHDYSTRPVNGPRALASEEIDEVSGGIAPLLIAWGIGFAAGMAYGRYLAE